MTFERIKEFTDDEWEHLVKTRMAGHYLPIEVSRLGSWGVEVDIVSVWGFDTKKEAEDFAQLVKETFI